MKNFKTLLLCLFLIGLSQNTSAQFWKKLKKKAQEKISKAEDKLIEKLDKKTDKKIDDTLDGKKKKEKVNDRNKDVGDATISHSHSYPIVKIDYVTRARVNKTGNKFKIRGNWRTMSADVFDGYTVTIKNSSLEELQQGKTFQIPGEADLYIGYDPFLDDRKKMKENWHGNFENRVESGTVTVKFIKDKSLSVSFSANGTLKKYIETNRQLDEGYYDKKPISIMGSVSSQNPEFSMTREQKEEEKDPVDNISEKEKMEIFKKALPTVNIPSSFSFNKAIEVKMTDDRGDSQNVEFLIGRYPDIYGLNIAAKEMQGQNMMVVNTPKSSTMFMNMAGMKVKKSTSLEQMGSQYNIQDKLPEEGDYEYKKTGNTKTILGYKCEEVKVEYDYTNSKGSASFWVSKDFPIQNKAIPMIGMSMNNPYFSGFVLQMETVNNGRKYSIEVVNVSDKTVNINTNDYKKFGF